MNLDVAVAGLPEVQEKHAVVMARFAWECLIKMHQVTKDLEVSLGPDTGELSMYVCITSRCFQRVCQLSHVRSFCIFLGAWVFTAVRSQQVFFEGTELVSSSLVILSTLLPEWRGTDIVYTNNQIVKADSKSN